MKITSACILALSSLSLTLAKLTKDIQNSLENSQYTIKDLQRYYRQGRLTSTELISFYLEREERLDKNGPKLNSIIELSPTLLKQVHHADQQFEKCRQLQLTDTESSNNCFDQLGSLAGIPILVKDNIATREMTTAAGSLALVGSIVQDDADIVKNLRNQGAIIMGKAGMTEWANFRSSMTNMDGWSGRGGQVLNPYGPDKLVSGSSSGCGAAVAANLATACIGTETYGSITGPANANGVYGFRPAAGSISSNGIIPITKDEDAAGPLCRNVEDCNMLWNVLRGTRFNSSTHSDNIQKLKIGYFSNDSYFYGNTHENVLQHLQSRGATLVEFQEPWGFSRSMDIDAHFHCRFKEDLENYLSTVTNTSIKLISDIIDFNTNHSQVERLDDFDQKQFITALTAPTYKTEPEYCSSLRNLYRGIGKYDSQMGYESLYTRKLFDVFLSGDKASDMSNLAGYPSLAVPLGMDEYGNLDNLILVSRTGSENAMTSLAMSIANGFNRTNPRLSLHRK